MALGWLIGVALAAGVAVAEDGPEGEPRAMIRGDAAVCLGDACVQGSRPSRAEPVRARLEGNRLLFTDGSASTQEWSEFDVHLSTGVEHAVPQITRDVTVSLGDAEVTWRPGYILDPGDPFPAGCDHGLCALIPVPDGATGPIATPTPFAMPPETSRWIVALGTTMTAWDGRPLARIEEHRGQQRLECRLWWDADDHGTPHNLAEVLERRGERARVRVVAGRSEATGWVPAAALTREPDGPDRPGVLGPRLLARLPNGCGFANRAFPVWGDERDDAAWVPPGTSLYDVPGGRVVGRAALPTHATVVERDGPWSRVPVPTPWGDATAWVRRVPEDDFVPLIRPVVLDLWSRIPVPDPRPPPSWRGTWEIAAVLGEVDLERPLAGDPWGPVAFDASRCRIGRQVRECAAAGDTRRLGYETWTARPLGDKLAVLMTEESWPLAGHHGPPSGPRIVVLRPVSPQATHMNTSRQLAWYEGPSFFQRAEPALEGMREGESDDEATCAVAMGLSSDEQPHVLLDVWGCPDAQAQRVRGVVESWTVHRHIRNGRSRRSRYQGWLGRTWMMGRVRVP